MFYFESQACLCISRLSLCTCTPVDLPPPPAMAAPHLCCGKFSPHWGNYVPPHLLYYPPVAHGTRQSQNTTKIPNSQSNQACVRHDGAVDGTKVPPPTPKEPKVPLLSVWEPASMFSRVSSLNMSGNDVNDCSAAVASFSALTL